MAVTRMHDLVGAACIICSKSLRQAELLSSKALAEPSYRYGKQKELCIWIVSRVHCESIVLVPSQYVIEVSSLEF